MLVGSRTVSHDMQQYLDKVARMRESDDISEPPSLSTSRRFGRFLLAKIPAATLTSLGTLFNEPKDGGEKEASSTTMRSRMDEEDYEYHEHLNSLQPVASSRGTSTTMCSSDGM